MSIDIINVMALLSYCSYGNMINMKINIIMNMDMNINMNINVKVSG